MFTTLIFIIATAAGLLMGFLYKKVTTTAKFFEFDAKKVQRVFDVLLSIGCVSAGTFALLILRTLHTAEIPEQALLSCQNYHALLVFSTNFSFLALMLVANMLSQVCKRVLYITYLIVFGYFTATIFLNHYLNTQLVEFRAEQQMASEPLTLMNATMKSLFAALVTAINAIAIWWGLRK